MKEVEILDHKVNEQQTITAAPADEPPKARPNFPIVVKTNRIKLEEFDKLEISGEAPAEKVVSEAEKPKELPQEPVKSILKDKDGKEAVAVFEIYDPPPGEEKKVNFAPDVK